VAFRGSAAALLILLSACPGVGDEQAEDVVFRVAATTGLSPTPAGPSLQGSWASAIDLVYDTVGNHIDAQELRGRRVILRRKASSPYSAAQLAASFRYQGLVSARALGPDQLETVFVDEATARWSVDSLGAVFDVGPFQIESAKPGRVRLRRRGERAIDVIEIVEMAASDEWRKLMARELDVMSSAANLYRKQFAGMRSVRLLDIPATLSTALYFNVRDPTLRDAAIRRRIAAGLNHQAIARIAGGDATSAAPPVTGGAVGDVPLPSSLSLLLVQDESTMVLTASVLRHEFDRMGVAVEVQPVNLERLLSQIDGGRFQLLLLPLPNGPRRFGRFVTTPPGIPPLTGFSDPAYDAAVAASDLAKAQEILDRELPATVLFETRAFAAIDSRFCGDVTPSPISWRWMADLHLCDSGKGEGKSTP
jgi:hypothetical protein